MFHRFAILVLICELLQLNNFAQVSSPAAGIRDLPLRIEIPAQSVNETYKVIPVGTSGLLLYYRSLEKSDPGSVNWYFALYDTNLQQVWVKPVPVPEEHNIILSDQCDDTLAFLYVATGKSKGNDHRYEILRIKPGSGTMLINKGTLEGPSDFIDFVVRNDRAWIGINPKNQSGRIVTMKLKSGAVQSFGLGAGTGLFLLSLHTDNYPDKIRAVVCRQISKKESDYFLAGYDTTGRLVSEILVGTPGEGKTLSNFRISPVIDGRMIITGSYCQGQANAAPKSIQDNETTGFFCSSITDGKQQSIKFYNYLQFRSADSFLGEKDILDLKKKALKKNRPLDEYSLDFKVYVHDLVSYNGQFLLAGELFSPQYHSETFTDFDFYGRPYTNSYSVFDGYRYANAIIACFDLNGNFSWDNTIEMRNFLTMELRKNLVVMSSGNNLVMFYLNEGVVGSKIIDEGDVVEKTDFTRMELMYPEDNLVSETKGIVQRWYGNYCIMSGYQEIKNIARVANNKRLVFYLSKLLYTP